MTTNDEVRFRKSTRSNGQNACVEIARPRSLFRVRDAKNTDGPALSFGEPQGLAFLALVKQD